MNDNLVMDDSWDDINLSDLTDEGEVSEETETDAGESAAEEGESTEAPEASQPTETEVRNDDLFTLKYMGEEKSVNREEIVDLAEKGMNYDRVKGQLEEARTSLKELEQVKGDLAKRNEQLQYLEELAKEQNQTLDELIETTQAQMMSRKTGQNIEVCKGIVKNQRLERELKARQSEPTAVDLVTKMRAHVEEFLRAYPDYDPKDMSNLPPEVWAAVDKGESLLSAYRALEVKQLRAQLDKERQEAAKAKRKEENRSRSVGSQRTEGTKQVDPFDAAWYDGT